MRNARALSALLVLRKGKMRMVSSQGRLDDGITRGAALGFKAAIRGL